MVNVTVSHVDESLLPDEKPGDYVMRLAEAKVHAAVHNDNPDLVVIGSDTTVADENEILGKPADKDEAIKMLKQLRGHSHQVYTAIAAMRVTDGRLLRDLCVTDVPMRSYSDEEIETYVNSGDPMDKAGAYAIQHPDFHPVVNMQGCFASVMGLPMCHLERLLRQFDITPKASIAYGCQKMLNYSCPVTQKILRGMPTG